MDYFGENGNSDNGLSLQDMIECDIKSEIEEQLASTAEAMLSSPQGLECFAADLLNANGLSVEQLVAVSSSSGDGQCATDSKFDPSWLLQTVNHNSVQSLLEQTTQTGSLNGNSDPNLLVNPQTGLPVTLQSLVLPTDTVSQQPSALTIVTPVSAVSRVSQPKSQMHYVAVAGGQLHNRQPTVISLQQQNQLQQVTSAQRSTPSPLQTVHTTHIVSSNASQNGSFSSQTPLMTQQLLTTNNNHMTHKIKVEGTDSKSFPKPGYSYSCLIAMALKNSDTGALPVSEIYSFMTENFPYFKTAPDGWKNSVRHNLSLNKCFEKIENPKANGNTRKGCLWGLNPAKIEKMDEEIAKWRKKDPGAIKRSMAKPDVLDMLEKGNVGSQSPRHPNNIVGGHYQGPGVGCTTSASLRGSVGGTICTTASITVIPTGPALPGVAGARAGPHTPAKLGMGHVGQIAGDIQVSMIEIKPPVERRPLTVPPVKIKLENGVVVRSAQDSRADLGGLLGGVLGAAGVATIPDGEELNVLDSSLLDPALTDLALQSGFWEDLGNDTLNLDDIALSSFGGTLTTPGNSITSSPLTIQTTKTESSSGVPSPLITLRATAGKPGSFSISRTVSART